MEAKSWNTIRHVQVFSYSLVDDGSSSDESDTEEDTKLRRLTDMGFTEEEAENALKSTSNNLYSAVQCF
jgi:uncharacterized UBP type Zn finger protein